MSCANLSFYNKIMLIVALGGRFGADIWNLVHTFPFLRFVLAEIYDFAFVITNMDRQMCQTLNIVLYNLQICISIILSCWWLIRGIDLKPNLDESHISIFTFGRCWIRCFCINGANMHRQLEQHLNIALYGHFGGGFGWSIWCRNCRESYVSILRLVLTGLHDCAHVLTNKGRQMEEHLNSVPCHMLIWISIINTC